MQQVIYNIKIMITVMTVLKFVLRNWLYFAFGLVLSALFVTYNTMVIERKAKVLAQNNFTSLSKGTTVWKTRAGNYAASVRELQLSKEQLKSSSDKRINDLIVAVDNMDIKLKNVSTIMSAQATMIANFKVKIVHDTIVNGVFFHEWEKYKSRNLEVIRHLIRIDSAEYNYKYHNSLYAAISSFKDGKWKIKNIFTPRRIINKLSITSDDPNYKLDSLYMITPIK